jgi:transcriptional regulator GlxA family with amidase domain
MKVAIVIFDGVQALDVAGPLDVFAEANTILPERQKYEVSLISPRTGTLTWSNGMQLAVSRRAFSKVFATYAKVTPSAFVEQVRLDTARKLLEDTDASLKTVAFECGFHSATHMRTSIAQRLAVTPKQCRQRFRGDAGKQPSVKSVNNGAHRQASLQGLSAL